jgi:hypothetical protein
VRMKAFGFARGIRVGIGAPPPILKPVHARDEGPNGLLRTNV